MKIRFIAELIKGLYQADHAEKLGKISYEDTYILIGYVHINHEDIEGIETVEDVINFYNETFRCEEK